MRPFPHEIHRHFCPFPIVSPPISQQIRLPCSPQIDRGRRAAHPGISSGGWPCGAAPHATGPRGPGWWGPSSGWNSPWWWLVDWFKDVGEAPFGWNMEPQIWRNLGHFKGTCGYIFHTWSTWLREHLHWKPRILTFQKGGDSGDKFPVNRSNEPHLGPIWCHANKI